VLPPADSIDNVPSDSQENIQVDEDVLTTAQPVNPIQDGAAAFSSPHQWNSPSSAMATPVAMSVRRPTYASKAAATPAANQ